MMTFPLLANDSVHNSADNAYIPDIYHQSHSHTLYEPFEPRMRSRSVTITDVTEDPELNYFSGNHVIIFEMLFDNRSMECNTYATINQILSTVYKLYIYIQSIIMSMIVALIGYNHRASMKHWLHLLFIVSIFPNIANAQSHYVCGTNQWCMDVYPSVHSSISSQVFLSADAAGIATNFTISFAIKETDCFTPRITFRYERIDYDGSAEYLNVYDNDNTLLAQCITTTNVCNAFSTCISDQSLNISLIEASETYQIRVYQSSAVNALCNDRSINAAVELFCAQSPTFAPTVYPTHAPTSTTTAPTAVTSSPTRPTAIPTAAPSAGPTVSPTGLPTVTPTMQSAAPTIAPTMPPTLYPTVTPTAPTSTPTTVTVPPTTPSETPTTAIPTAAPSMPTSSPVFAPTGKIESLLYSIHYINDRNTSCANLVDNIGFKYNITLTSCTNWCDSTVECTVFNYFVDISRCYMFDGSCDITREYEEYTSIVGYFMFDTECMDYPYDWSDHAGDDCSFYESNHWCTNNAVDSFTDATYKRSALDTCCPCGGGNTMMDGVAFSIDNDWIEFETDILCTWSHNDITSNTVRLRKWDNMMLFHLCTQFDVDVDHCYALIDTHFDRDGYSLHLCEYTTHDTQQFIMDLIVTNGGNHEFYVNTLWFELSTSYYSNSSRLNVTQMGYSECISNIKTSASAHNYGAHPCHVGYNYNITSNNQTPTTNATSSMKSELYSLEYLSQNALCVELYSNIGVKLNISLADCSDWCEDTYDCILFNYMDDLKEMHVSRCYVFDTSCSIMMIDPLQSSINPVIGYYEHKKSCMDYPYDWTDNVDDNCSYYESYNWCHDGNILRDELQFYNLIDRKYTLSGMDVCCDCGGGVTAMDGVVFSLDHWIRMDLDVLCDWAPISGISNKNQLRNWNNIILYSMCTDLTDINCDFLIDSLINPPEYGYSLYICAYDASVTDGNDFMFDIAMNHQTETYDIFINTFWFNLDLSQYSPHLNIIHSNYSFCLADAVDPTRHATHHYGAHPCYVFDYFDTLSPTWYPTDATADDLDPAPRQTDDPSKYIIVAVVTLLAVIAVIVVMVFCKKHVKRKPVNVAVRRAVGLGLQKEKDEESKAEEDYKSYESYLDPEEEHKSDNEVALDMTRPHIGLPLKLTSHTSSQSAQSPASNQTFTPTQLQQFKQIYSELQRFQQSHQLH
eukprot:435976_1